MPDQTGIPLLTQCLPINVDGCDFRITLVLSVQKACLEVDDFNIGVSALRMSFYKRLIQLLLFVRIHGWRGLQRKIVSLFSARCLYTRLRQSRQARKLYRSSSSNRSKSNDNDHAD